jgi:hypothetical protein
MALLYAAQLNPSKIDLIRAWVPNQPWAGSADPADLIAVGAYRFDDPAGEVGIETHLVRAGDDILHVPLTYRPAPLPGAEPALVGTMDHSVLGPRWVYDGCADPVYATALATAILTGGTEAELIVDTDGSRERREPTTRVVGSGGGESIDLATESDTVQPSSDEATTRLRIGSVALVVRRRVDEGAGVAHSTPGTAFALHGTWPGRDEPTLLALARAT